MSLVYVMDLCNACSLGLPLPFPLSLMLCVCVCVCVCVCMLVCEFSQAPLNGCVNSSHHVNDEATNLHTLSLQSIFMSAWHWRIQARLSPLLTASGLICSGLEGSEVRGHISGTP